MHYYLCIHSCVALHTPHSFMHYIYSCVALTDTPPSFMHCIDFGVLTRSHTTLVYALHLFISCINLCAASCLVFCLALYELQGLILPDQLLLLSCIAYTASYLLACIFSLPCIKPNIQLLIEETQADGYKAPSFPHSYSLFLD